MVKNEYREIINNKVDFNVRVDNVIFLVDI